MRQQSILDEAELFVPAVHFKCGVGGGSVPQDVKQTKGEGPTTLSVSMERSIVVFLQSIWIPFAVMGKALLFWLYWAKEDGPQSWRQLLPSFDCYSSFSHRIINITAFSLGSSIDRLSVPLLLMLGAPMQPKLGLILMLASLVWRTSELCH